MTIGSVTGTGSKVQAGRSGMNMQEDAVSKRIQNQIANAQKELQELSSNKDMTPEEKMKKRQEIQQEINTLNQQLRQHQIEQRKERSKDISKDDMHGGSRKAEKAKGKGSGMSQASMQAMISADSSLKQAKVQGSTATQMEGRAGVLEIEIKLDKDRGGSTEKKEEELADLQEKAQAATSSQFSTLADAREAMEEASKADSNANSRTEEAKNKDEKAENKDETAENKYEIAENKDKKADKAAETQIDIRL